jgi:ribosomal protein L34E
MYRHAWEDGPMRIDLTCAGCDGNRFDYPFALKDTSVITCADCGREIGTVADMQQTVIEALESQKAPA